MCVEIYTYIHIYIYIYVRLKAWWSPLCLISISLKHFSSLTYTEEMVSWNLVYNDYPNSGLKHWATDLLRGCHSTFPFLSWYTHLLQCTWFNMYNLLFFRTLQYSGIDTVHLWRRVADNMYFFLQCLLPITPSVFLTAQGAPWDFKLAMIIKIPFCFFWHTCCLLSSLENMTKSLQIVKWRHWQQSRGNETGHWILDSALLHTW